MVIFACMNVRCAVPELDLGAWSSVTRVSTADKVTLAKVSETRRERDFYSIHVPIAEES